MAHNPGDQICGRFELVRAEAEGTGSPLFGDSWAAVDSESGEVVRLVLLGPGLIPGAAAREALTSRLDRLCSRGQDDMLVPLSFVGQDGEHVVAAFEGLYAGISLADVVADLEVDDRLPELGRLIADLALGLAILHGRGLLHGCLGIETIFVWERGNALWQHALAGACDPTAIAAKIAETGLLVAPEVAETGQLSAASDVFAWASVIATYASGLPPQEALDALRRGEILGKSGKLLQLLQAAVDPSPSARPANGSRLIEGLQAACLIVVDGEEDTIDEEALTALAEAGIDPVTFESLPPEVGAAPAAPPEQSLPAASAKSPPPETPPTAAKPLPVTPAPPTAAPPTAAPPTAAKPVPVTPAPPTAAPPKSPPPSLPSLSPPAPPELTVKPPARPPILPPRPPAAKRANPPTLPTKPPPLPGGGAPALPPRPPLTARAEESAIPGIPQAPAGPAPVAASPASVASPAAPSISASPVAPDPTDEVPSPIGDAVAAALGGALSSLGDDLPPYLPPIGEIQEPSGVRPAAVVVKGGKGDKEPEEGKKKIHLLEPSGSRSVSPPGESSGGLKTSALVNMALAGGRTAGEPSQRVGVESSSLSDAVSAATAVLEPSAETPPSMPDLPEVAEGGRDRRTHPLGWAIEDIEGHPSTSAPEDSGADDSAASGLNADDSVEARAIVEATTVGQQPGAEEKKEEDDSRSLLILLALAAAVLVGTILWASN